MNNEPLKYQYYAITDAEIVARMYCKFKLQPNNWYKMDNCQMIYNRLYWCAMGCNATIRIQKCEYQLIKLNQQTTNQALHKILDKIQSSLQKIIDFAMNVEKFNEVPFKKLWFSSLHNVCTNKIKQDTKHCILAQLTHHSIHYSKTKSSYCFNIKSEDRKMSIIYWGDISKLDGWIGKYIQTNTKVIFADVVYKVLGRFPGKPYFAINSNSYAIYDLCEPLLHLMQQGKYDVHHVPDIQLLWPPNDRITTHTIFKDYTTQEMKSIKETHTYIDKHWDSADQNISVIAKINSSHIKKNNDTQNEIYIKIYCSECRNSERSIQYTCRLCGNDVTPWFQADTYITIKEPGEDKIQVKMGIPLITMSKIYSYCKKYGISNTNLSYALPTIENILKNNNYIWQTTEECQAFVPLIEAFYKHAANDKNMKFYIMITKIRSNGQIYTNYKLHNIEFDEKENNKATSSDNTNNYDTTKNDDNVNNSNKRKRTDEDDSLQPYKKRRLPLS